ncbi:PTS sugar transporter subunit IIA [Virgibacillus proomii]|uniref:PTS sugar transporter subunit IIA n=1 Tax=Virgibacillus proomii TaxID=84407 RepID=UPI001C0FBBDD|nr:PTS sugar transporter subunit IIA [Virgibacillus proomii]MBU5267572.1 PTS sugar transporter subunit IIA [Virgibacillus proomii]
MFKLNEDLVILCDKPVNKENVIKQISLLLYEQGYISNMELFIEHVLEREKAGSTYIGNNIAMPHCESASVESNSFVIFKSNQPLSWNEHKVNIVALFVLHPNSSSLEKQYYKKYIKALGDEKIVKDLKKANDKEKIVMLFES